MEITPILASSPDPFAMVLVLYVPWVVAGLALIAIAVNSTVGRRRWWGLLIGCLAAITSAVDLIILFSWGDGNYSNSDIWNAFSSGDSIYLWVPVISLAVSLISFLHWAQPRST